MTNIYESYCSEGVRILMVENIEYSFQTEAEMLYLVPHTTQNFNSL